MAWPQWQLCAATSTRHYSTASPSSPPTLLDHTFLCNRICIVSSARVVLDIPFSRVALFSSAAHDWPLLNPFQLLAAQNPFRSPRAQGKFPLTPDQCCTPSASATVQVECWSLENELLTASSACRSSSPLPRETRVQSFSSTLPELPFS
jgi:hypothetical protein